MTRFHDMLAGRETDRPPFWFMRQAGRYLPEYRKVRGEAGDFLSLCYNPELATEVTLQPIRRYGMDAAIIFSDILVVPHALGRAVRFETGEGPRLEPMTQLSEVVALEINNLRPFLAPVYAAISATRKALPKEHALIGFAGAPWTLLCYMLEGRGKTGFPHARKAIYGASTMVQALTDRLVEAVSEHLVAQVEAGADALQLFDSWAGLCPAGAVERLVTAPAKAIVETVRKRCPGVPIICFPKGIGYRLEDYVKTVKPDGLGVDTETSIEAIAGVSCVLQGNLDPLLLASDREGTLAEAKRLSQAMRGKRFIFNLGHGVVPETDPETVAHLCDLLHGEAA